MDNGGVQAEIVIDGDGTVEIVLEPGEVLCAKGERLDVVYQVRSGALGVIGDDDTELAVLDAPALIGDISAIAGGMTTAEVRASEPSRLAAIPLATFEAWLATHPDEAASITATARRRANRTRSAAIIADLVGPTTGVDPTVILDRLETQMIEAGEVLFSQGDESDAAYIVLTGRLQIEQRALSGDGSPTGDVVVDVEVGRGALVGELGIIDDDVRSATVRAVRTTMLARLGRTDFEALAAAHPSLTLRIVRALLDRMRFPTRAVSKARALTVVVTDPIAREGSAEPSVVATMADEVRRFGPTDFVEPGVADTMLGRPGLARSQPGTVAHDRLLDQLHEIEANSDYLMFGVDQEPGIEIEADPWIRRAVEGSDRLIIVASANPRPEERDEIDRLASVAARGVGTPVWLVRRYAPGSKPHGAARWLQRDDIAEVHQVQVGDDVGLRRVARLATGNGVGLVLSGGGGRGFAHLGVFRALAEEGIEVDALAGTSIGAVMGASVAIGVPQDDRVDLVAQAFHNLLDYTVPIVALLRSERITRNIEDTFGAWQIEDCWVPMAVVSTSLTSASVRVHRTGPLATAVRASVSLPAVLPPVAFEGELLVDGGVLDNLPVDLAVDDERVGTVIAVDLEAPAAPSSRSEFHSGVSGLKALAAQLHPGRKNYPTIGSTLIRSLLVAANRRREEVLAEAAMDLTIVLDLEGVGLLDFERVAEIAELGYESAKPQISAWARDRQSTPVQ